MNDSATNGASRERKFDRPDLPSKCKWEIGGTEDSPHTSRPRPTRPDVLPNILEFIGNTPLIKLNKIPLTEGIKCDMYAKCEFLNPGGSVKDRIGYRMVLDAEEQGLLPPGCTIIEPTSGNTGIGIAIASAIKGYKCIIVLPEKMSDEKVNTLLALGAEIRRTPSDVAWNSPHGNLMVAHELHKSIPNSIILNQYRNAGNPLAHYDGTGSEILQALNFKVDMVVLGTGTGGTMTGVARKIKEELPGCKFIAADPEGSLLANPSKPVDPNLFYEVEGIGYDFVPTVLDHKIVDKWVKVNDKMSFHYTRRLIKEEGLLCGGSSGAAMAAALQEARALKKGQVCVVILPDSVRNYMTKLVFDQWLEARDFKELPCIPLWWWNVPVSSMNLLSPKTVAHDTTSDAALVCLYNQSAVPVLDDFKWVVGVITSKELMKRRLYAKPSVTEKARDIMIKRFYKVEKTTPVGLVARILEIESYVVVVEKHKINVNEEKETATAVISKTDLLKFIQEGPKAHYEHLPLTQNNSN